MQGYDCPPPSLLLDNFSPVQNRYIDISAGGPTPFTFKVTSNASWPQLSSSQGSISSSEPEQRIFLNIEDWGRLNDGANTAVITFTATSAQEPPLIVALQLGANKFAPPAGFKGENFHVHHEGVAEG